MRVPNLTALRAEAGLTQSQLSERSGVSKDTISKLESGEHAKAQAVTTAKLAHGLGVRSEILSAEDSLAQDDSHNGRCGRAVEDRIELFEIGKDLDEHRLGLLLEVGRQFRAAYSVEAGTEPAHYESAQSPPRHGPPAGITSVKEEIGS